MAIYTNYGRYLKAKQFKEMLEEQGETYMLFGLGNPQWDNPDSAQDIPIAAYNNEAMYNPENQNENQFFDDHANVYFNTGYNSETHKAETVQTLEDGKPRNLGNQGMGDPLDRYMYLSRRIIPPFPCIFSGDDDVTSVLSEVVTQSNYQNYIVTKEGGSYQLRDLINGGDSTTIPMPPDGSLEAQYFAEMYIRGKALAKGLKAPVGLLGAVKCNVDFVKDIGPENSPLYTGSIDQFWYGDRYWQTVNVNENDLIGDAGTYIDVDDADRKQETFPHHIMFTATVNPRVLCEELNIDQYLVPRQIAIYTRRKPIETISGVNETEQIKTNIDANTGKVYATYTSGKLYYRAYEHIFNFGQYSQDEINSMANNPLYSDMDRLNFTLPCKCGTDDAPYNTPNGEFKFLLNDYIRGQVRESHSVDRFGYVVSF